MPSMIQIQKRWQTRDWPKVYTNDSQMAIKVSISETCLELCH